MPYLIDSDWAINALRGRDPAAAMLRRIASQRPFVSLVTVADIYDAAFNSPNHPAHLANSRQFLGGLRTIGLDDPIAERFPETRAFLPRRGLLIADIDIFIAATALHYDLILLTFNVAHFRRMPGLRVYRPR